MEAEINSIVKEALSKAKSIFPVEDISVEIKEDSELVIPETGAGGYTPDSNTIFIYYDSNNMNLKKHLQDEIRSTVTHEFHHAIRNRAYNWKEDTLLGAMITEGLADHFDLEVNGGEQKPWSTALNDAEIEIFKKIAEPEFNSREYNHAEWFFGSEKRNIPKWTGYALGFKLVGDYLNKMGKRASELVAEPAEAFLN